jgi:uncharacterized UPF0160 family protein
MTAQEIVPRSFGTHDGPFHADDVTACALLLTLNLIDETAIFRSREPVVLDRCEYVCDVGGIYDPKTKRFDHHQVSYSGSLSSAGMILEYLRSTKLLPSKEADFLNISLIRGVDAHDNGKDPQLPGFCFFSHVVSNFAPIKYDVSPKEQDATFLEAVHFAKNHLSRLLERYRYTLSCRNEVEQVMAACHDYLVFDRCIPWMDAFFDLEGALHPAKFVIMPTGTHWKARGIPPTNDDRMRVRLPFPESWAGLLEKDLKNESKLPGALFCHKGRFISVWETRTDAIRAVEHILQLKTKR